MSEAPVPVLPPKEALAFFRAKGLARSFAWQDIFAAQHDYWFTIAKMMSVSLLEDVHALIGDAMEAGTSPQQLARDLKAKLQERGWWGRQLQTDPLDGERKVVQLGSDRRVRVIVNTNLRTSYSAGRYARQDRVREAFPILVYKSRMDGRERPEHHAWHNIALPIGDPWWLTHYPPCDWGCRCRTVSMTAKQAERRGLDLTAKPAYAGMRRWTNKRTGEVMEVERGIGAGWDYHPGRAKLEGLSPDPLFGYSGGGTSDGTSIAAAVPSAIARFLDRFSLGGEGGIWRDATGWPLAVTPRWLKGLSVRKQNLAALAAAAIAAPQEIRLIWVTGKDGRAMLVRRYIDDGFVVDVGNNFWRFSAVGRGQGARLRAGVVIWSLDGRAMASYDPHQARDARGRWRSARALAVALATRVYSGDNSKDQVRLGPLDDRARSRLEALGLRSDAKSIAIDGDAIRHIRDRHGRDSRGQVAIAPKDFGHVRTVFLNGEIQRGTPPVHPRRGTPLLYVRHKTDNADYAAVFEVRKHRIHLYSLRKR